MWRIIFAGLSKVTEFKVQPNGGERFDSVIFKPGEKDFSTNGLGRLVDATRCEITEANGKYELEMDYPAISRFSDYFENGYQIKSKAK